jgi:hypothetical protein
VTAALIEVTDEQALATRDAYGRATTGKPYLHNRRGGWCLYPATCKECLGKGRINKPL